MQTFEKNNKKKSTSRKFESYFKEGDLRRKKRVRRLTPNSFNDDGVAYGVSFLSTFLLTPNYSGASHRSLGKIP